MSNAHTLNKRLCLNRDKTFEHLARRNIIHILFCLLKLIWMPGFRKRVISSDMPYLVYLGRLARRPYKTDVLPLTLGKGWGEVRFCTNSGVSGLQSRNS